MGRMLLVSSLLLLMVSCAFKPPQTTSFPPQARDVPLALTPGKAYERAYKTFVQAPGWMITSANTDLKTFQGEINKAVTMTIMVAPDAGKGSVVTIHGVPLPHVTGTFTEVDDYAKRLQEAK